MSPDVFYAKWKAAWDKHVAKVDPSARIRERISALEAIRANYLGYLQCRISESDWHGAWDASVNISETEAELAGLRFAMDLLKE